MKVGNMTTATEFIILGLSDNPQLQVPLFLVFLLIYLITLLGNLVIITVTCADPRLHTPMYFFLSNLALTDVCYSSNIVPKLLEIFLSRDKIISYAGCMVQLYFFLDFGCTETLLLTAMAYDRYAAICDPLRYSLIMNHRVCVLLAAASWINCFLLSGMITVSVTRLSFCASNVIDHFFCEFMPLLKLSCSETATIQSIMFVIAALMTVPAFFVTLTSYSYIISAILRIRSAEGKRKAFSTCSSHLTVVSVFYLSIFFVYLRPTSSYSQEQGKLLSILYAAVTPMLNPLIYSMRNKEVKNAIDKGIRRKNKSNTTPRQPCSTQAQSLVLHHHSPSYGDKLWNSLPEDVVSAVIVTGVKKGKESDIAMVESLKSGAGGSSLLPSPEGKDPAHH
ncbi:olfactory receptor 151-like [Rhinatrema bivittatum]|uniref:olfactory receptor 151-like n=1 Tax=Rhinatrema bivittatum TaxID=194408 RepID=UPI00112ED99C|nr:olfactory receptor 151-like [Rhinatrema bivittatum]